jgi:lysine decarboxylase
MNTPIYDMLLRHMKKCPVPFHMPGHLSGRGLPAFLREAGRMDLTEIPGTDDLHHPEGAIKEAQELAARLYGAGRTFFLVNGSTAGIYAMIRSAVKPGGRILMGRDCHRSVINAVALMGLDPVYIMPEYDELEDLPLGYDEEGVIKAIAGNPGIEAVLLTRPNYYGIASGIGRIADAAHSIGIPLLIDEAHGAHFPFHPDFPASALKSGADACVQSLHKTLPSLTQTAFLHVAEDSPVDARKAQESVSMLQTTSPSYIFMASMDIAREMMQTEGFSLYSGLRKRILLFDRKLESIPGVRRAAAARIGYDADFSRVVLSFRESGLTGYEAERMLREEWGIYPEMADGSHVVFIVTPYHDEADLELLIKALREVAGSGEAGRGRGRAAGRLPGLPERIMLPGEAINSEREIVNLEDAAGRTAAAALTPYPPGIPLVMPGERISADFVQYATEILHSGGRVHGIMDYGVPTVKS